MKDVDGDCAVMMALYMNHLDVVRYLVGMGAGLHVLNKKGLCPLLWACQEGRNDVVDMLIAAGAQGSVANNNGTTGLHLATESGHIGIVDTLLTASGVYVDAQDASMTTSLHIAVRNGRNRLVGLFLEHGADAGIANRRGQTALILACQAGQIDTALLLIKLVGPGLNVNYTDSEGWSALHWAVANGMTDVVSHLIDAIPDLQIDQRTEKENQTPLILAAKEGFQHIVYLLLMNGADCNFDPGDGCTALYWAGENDHKNIVQILIEA